MSLIMSTTTNSSSSSQVTQLETQSLVFDSNLLQKQQSLPNQFVWPNSDLSSDRVTDELNEPLVDLRSDAAPELVRRACLRHGFFQVVNHGVDQDLIRAAHREMDAIFGLPLSSKLAARRKPGSLAGYSGAHADRYSTKLPWKETFSFPYFQTDVKKGSDHSTEVVDYFNSVLGRDFETTGRVYQKYCKAMRELSLVIMEVLGVSLGVDRLFFRKFFEDSHSIMRCNFYPPCKNSGLTLGTGPHSDPTSLTILHQDQVGGLEVFVNNKWNSVRPRADALVVNIGDTFVALSNGRYKSCLHRAVVNRERIRRSLVFFVSPREDRVVRPPKDLITFSQRVYPDFTWSDLLHFTQNHYRADVSTLQTFIHWLRSSKPSSHAST